MRTFGILMGEINEKSLIQLADKFLIEFFGEKENEFYNVYKSNKFKKQKNHGGIEDLEHPEKTFIYDYSYDYYNKYLGVDVMIYANRNKSGENKYDENIEWILEFNEGDFYINGIKSFNGKNPDVNEFIKRFLVYLGLRYISLQ